MLGLPPEIISAQIHSGPGSAALTAASTAWTNLASELEQAAVGYRNVLTGLQGIWTGASAQTMAAAAARYVRWVEGTAQAARQSAAAAMGAASAYAEALSAVVPVPVIAANRAQLLLLVATNILGQNTAAIAANEAQYETMWAQDDAAMSAYSASSQAATSALPQFSLAPQVTTAVNPTPVGLSDVYGLLEVLLSLPVEIVGLFTSFFGPFLGSTVIAGQLSAQNSIIAGKPDVVVTPTPAPGGSPTRSIPSVRASTGSAERLGKLSVPPSWASPKNSRTSTAAEPNTPDGGKSIATPIGLPVIPAVPVTGGKATKRKKGSDPDDFDYGRPTPPILKRHPSGG